MPAGPERRRLRHRPHHDRGGGRWHADARNVGGRSEGADRLLLRLPDDLHRRRRQQRHERRPRGEATSSLQQFARFASKCRPFAPMYRQITLAGLRRRARGGADRRRRSARASSTTTCEMRGSTYLKHDNQGRGVVLIGHSQGSFILDGADRARDRRQAGPEAARSALASWARRC